MKERVVRSKELPLMFGPYDWKRFMRCLHGRQNVAILFMGSLTSGPATAAEDDQRPVVVQTGFQDRKILSLFASAAVAQSLWTLF